jgi:hypothetical protein
MIAVYKVRRERGGREGGRRKELIILWWRAVV